MNTVTLAVLFLFFFALNSFAKEGPRYIKVDRINSEIDKNDNAELVLSFEGKKADIFRKSLPPIVSGFPNLGKHINEVVFLDEKTKQSILISCANAKVTDDYKLERLDKTKCTVKLIKHDPALVGIEKDYGNAGEFKSLVCQK